MNRHRGFDDLPAVLTPREAAAVLRISRNSLYEALHRGEVPCLRIGRKLLIPRAALVQLLEGGVAATSTPESRGGLRRDPRIRRRSHDE